MTVRLLFDVDGIGRVEHRLMGMSARALAPQPILEGIAAAMRGVERGLFASEGRGTWAPLAPSTVARKGHDKILFEEGDLESSLTEEGGDHFEIVQGSELLFGTSDPKAAFHRTGTSRMPVRDPLQVQEQDLRAFSRAVQAWLVGSEAIDSGPGSFGAGLTVPFGV